jgi:hypothetical protein
MFRTAEEIFNTINEDLHPDIVPFVYEDPRLGTTIKHPLVFSIMHHSSRNAWVNESYKVKTEACKEALKAKKFASYIFLHERPYRFDAFVRVMHLMKDKEYWELLADAWVDSENLWQNLPQWKKLLKSTRKGREFFMTPEEREFLKKLPDTVTVYRGYQPGKNKSGLSYTLDEKKAEWFANRFTKTGEVHVRTVKREKIFAYLNGRGESEIILL